MEDAGEVVYLAAPGAPVALPGTGMFADENGTFLVAAKGGAARAALASAAGRSLPVRDVDLCVVDCGGAPGPGRSRWDRLEDVAAQVAEANPGVEVDGDGDGDEGNWAQYWGTRDVTANEVLAWEDESGPVVAATRRAVEDVSAGRVALCDPQGCTPREAVRLVRFAAAWGWRIADGDADQVAAEVAAADGYTVGLQLVRALQSGLSVSQFAATLGQACPGWCPRPEQLVGWVRNDLWWDSWMVAHLFAGMRAEHVRDGQVCVDDVADWWSAVNVAVSAGQGVAFDEVELADCLAEVSAQQVADFVAVVLDAELDLVDEVGPGLAQVLARLAPHTLVAHTSNDSPGQCRWAQVVAAASAAPLTRAEVAEEGWFAVQDSLSAGQVPRWRIPRPVTAGRRPVALAR